MTREELIKKAERMLDNASYQLEMDRNLNNGLRKIKENEYDFLHEVVLTLCAQQAPTKLDRSRWEGCVVCNRCGEGGSNELLCGGVKAKYCPFCGRPLTEEAWVELERREETDNEAD